MPHLKGEEPWKGGVNVSQGRSMGAETWWLAWLDWPGQAEADELARDS